MGYRSLRECVTDLERAGQLRRVSVEIDPYLEAALIQRRVYEKGGPAILFERLKGCRFPAVSNLFGTLERTQFMFRDTLDNVRRLVELKVDPGNAAKRPFRYVKAVPTAWAMRPKYVSNGPVCENRTTISELPPIVSAPADGGPFITLPIVYSEDVRSPGWMKSNLGMYRVQLSGNSYAKDEEVGLHYQIHRSIGVHHAAAIAAGKPFRVSIAVGGPPALTLSAVMPLPEGLSELTFAGALGGRRVRLVRDVSCRGFKDRRSAGYQPMAGLADADFLITGTVDPDRQLPEGPFGDHLGYYSLAHDFPVLKVEEVLHRKDAIWPFTVVGRPPQEDTSFGAIIHEITGPVIPTVLPGVKAVHAVDEAGVHPLLLAIGSERYVPYAKEREPLEILTQANAILGQGQLSLAKYLFIAAEQDDPRLDLHDIGVFLKHVLERVDWRRDLHFQTKTTIDTLDYSGSGLNSGSKLVVAAAGSKRRSLLGEVPSNTQLPDGFSEPQVVMPGVLCVQAPRHAGVSESIEERLQRPAESPRKSDGELRRFCDFMGHVRSLDGFPLIVLCDDSRFASESLKNWLWVTFTRSNPAADVDGVDAFVEEKHFGCRGPLVIDARIKPHHAPPIVDDPKVVKRVEELGAKGGPLHGLI
ncbi:4-hydroxybenzoate decarboxylase subunit C [Caulifigura coniformis]|uniref:4-hydroxybenzoate decarboxylase subunit C n=1 Tax=Caulifigura coniformis TaxID=2527983 RepID=A0A517SCF2_9PLAN|nr:UbiD family decarboxylase [Caulifigura coniformis]QDT53807.1 4-hydroxybenzoate decarboxylase subunit C [Caulifigura coniformis]